MKLYRIFTERLNTTKVAELAAVYFPGFSLFEGVGYWNRQREIFLCIEVVAPASEHPKVVALCTRIKELNTQETVMLLVTPINMEFI